MGASAPAVQQPAATRSHVPATDPGVVDTPVNGQNGATDPRVDDPRVKAVAEALSRPGLWAVILNVPAPPPANPVLWGLSSMAAAATGGQRRHWLGLKRFGDTWCVACYRYAQLVSKATACCGWVIGTAGVWLGVTTTRASEGPQRMRWLGLGRVGWHPVRAVCGRNGAEGGRCKNAN